MPVSSSTKGSNEAASACVSLCSGGRAGAARGEEATRVALQFGRKRPALPQGHTSSRLCRHCTLRPTVTHLRGLVAEVLARVDAGAIGQVGRAGVRHNRLRRQQRAQHLACSGAEWGQAQGAGRRGQQLAAVR